MMNVRAQQVPDSIFRADDIVALIGMCHRPRTTGIDRGNRKWNFDCTIVQQGYAFGVDGKRNTPGIIKSFCKLIGRCGLAIGTTPNVVGIAEISSVDVGVILFE